MPAQHQIEIYQANDGTTQINLQFEQELNEKATCKDFLKVRKEVVICKHQTATKKRTCSKWEQVD